MLPSCSTAPGSPPGGRRASIGDLRSVTAQAGSPRATRQRRQSTGSFIPPDDLKIACTIESAKRDAKSPASPRKANAPASDHASGVGGSPPKGSTAKTGADGGENKDALDHLLKKEAGEAPAAGLAPQPSLIAWRIDPPRTKSDLNFQEEMKFLF